MYTHISNIVEEEKTFKNKHVAVIGIVAHLAGDEEEARKVKLKLPETGVCRVGPSATPLEIDGLNTASNCCRTSCN